MLKFLLFTLFSTGIFLLSFGQETGFSTDKNIGFEPIIGLKKPEASLKSLSFDSTFVFSSDTLNLPVFDDFSTNKFQVFQGSFTAPGVTNQTFYRLLDVSTNLPISNGVFFTNQATFHRTYDIATGNITDLTFPATPNY